MMPEEDLREELATCARILAMQGLFALHGHVSVYQPETKRVLITPSAGFDKALLRPEDLVVADLAGKPLGGDIAPPREWPIHMALHAARPDAIAIAHLHPPYATLFAIAKRRYRPVTLHSGIFSGGVPLYSEAHLITTLERGASFLKAIGQSRAAFMRAHGITVVGLNLRELLYATLVLEDDSRKTLQAETLGGVEAVTDEECRLALEETPMASLAQRTWTYFSSLEARWNRQPGTGRFDLFP